MTISTKTLNLYQDNISSGAFYISKQIFKEKKISTKMLQNVKSSVMENIVNIYGQLGNFNLSKFAQNFSLQCPTERIHKYSTTVLSYILQNKPIKSEKILEMFFRCYAPIINMNLLGMSYENLNQLKSAIKTGNVEPVAFLQGLYSGLQKYQNDINLVNFNNGYEEIPLDVIEHFGFIYNEKNILSRRVKILGEYTVNRTDKVLINLVAHIHNKNDNLVKTNEKIQKLEQTMSVGKTDDSSSDNDLNPKNSVILRVGKDIFEHCRITDLKVDISQAYDDLRLNVNLYYYIHKDLYLNSFTDDSSDI